MLDVNYCQKITTKSNKQQEITPEDHKLKSPVQNMPSFGSRFGRLGEWWSERTRLEKNLMSILVGAILGVVIYSLCFRKSQPVIKTSPNICDTVACMQEATRVLQNVDPEADPCDDLYAFACLKTRDDDDTLADYDLTDLLQEQLIRIYRSEIASTDHSSVQFAKRFYKMCVNSFMNDVYGSFKIKSELTDLGGWPVLDGPHWKEDFAWLNASYRFREKGYKHSIFLDLSVEADPAGNDRLIFQVSCPKKFRDKMTPFYYDGASKILKIAKILGAADDNATAEQVGAIGLFWDKLIQNRCAAEVKKYTIEEYQKLMPQVDWFDFINRMAGPLVKVQRSDFVLFPPPETMTKWIETITNSSKTVQANYMFWELVKSVLPYLPTEISLIKNINQYNREAFCFYDAEERFLVSPIRIMYYRKHLPQEKIKKIQEFTEELRGELVAQIANASWMDFESQNKTLERLKGLKVVYTKYDNYLDDSGFEGMNYPTASYRKMLLDLVAESNKVLFDLTYREIDIPASVSVLKKDYIHYNRGLPYYNPKFNRIFFPAVGLQSPFFDDQRPNYLNYGFFGSIVGHFWMVSLEDLVKNKTHGWTKKTRDTFEAKVDCLGNKINYLVSQDQNVRFAFNIIAQKVSYNAFTRWKKKIATPRRIYPGNYTEEQLFWIYNAFAICNTNFNYYGIMLPEAVEISAKNNENFAKDFSCPSDSLMNIRKRCEMF